MWGWDLHRPAPLPLPDPGGTAPRADDKALGMERMRSRARTRPACAEGCERVEVGSADEAGDDVGNGAGMGISVGAPLLPSDRHAAQVVAPQFGITLLGLDKRAHRVTSGQVHFFRCGPQLFARDVAGSCLPRAFGLGKKRKGVQGSGACAPVDRAS